MATVTLDYHGRKMHLFPDDDHFSQKQWNMERINAPTGWDITTGSPKVIIAILDTGIDLAHADLAGRIIGGASLVRSSLSLQDPNGHGTRVASVAAATGNNGIGITSIDWQASIMPVKVLDSEGFGYDSRLIAGLLWAVDHGADVVNMSLGGTYENALLRDAVTYAYDHGVTLVASAGNDYEYYNAVEYPAAYPHVLAVAATNRQDEHAAFSTSGYFVDVAAPGVDIYAATLSSALEDAYANNSGTSQAAPHVAGLAALLRSIVPNATPDQIADLITSTAQDILAPG